ncbi:MAG: helix-turn-helix transcriptional regulator [Clostridiales bacterium]|nr:helix-turn-helix transcriptional regulator [Clostridiales bacterium]
MKLSTAVALRISNILRERNMSQYRLEKNIAMPHNTMKSLMGERNNSVNLKTVMQIVKGLDMTVAEFFNDPIFENPDLEIY